MPIPELVARFNRHVTNPVARLVAGSLPPFAIVVHRGRHSDREYHTPVTAFRTCEGFVVALMYGAEADWVRNVMKAGGCKLQRAGRTETLSNPRVVTGPEAMDLVPMLVRGPLSPRRSSSSLRWTAFASRFCAF